RAPRPAAGRAGRAGPAPAPAPAAGPAVVLRGAALAGRAAALLPRARHREEQPDRDAEGDVAEQEADRDPDRQPDRHRARVDPPGVRHPATVPDFRNYGKSAYLAC